VVGGEKIGRVVVADVVDQRAGAQPPPAAGQNHGHRADLGLPGGAFGTLHIHVAGARVAERFVQLVEHVPIPMDDPGDGDAAGLLDARRFVILQGARVAPGGSGGEFPVRFVVAMGEGAEHRTLIVVVQEEAGAAGQPERVVDQVDGIGAGAHQAQPPEAAAIGEGRPRAGGGHVQAPLDGVTEPERQAQGRLPAVFRLQGGNIHGRQHDGVDRRLGGLLKTVGETPFADLGRERGGDHQQAGRHQQGTGGPGGDGEGFTADHATAPERAIGAETRAVL